MDHALTWSIFLAWVTEQMGWILTYAMNGLGTTTLRSLTFWGQTVGTLAFQQICSKLLCYVSAFSSLGTSWSGEKSNTHLLFGKKSCGLQWNLHVWGSLVYPSRVLPLSAIGEKNSCCLQNFIWRSRQQKPHLPAGLCITAAALKEPVNFGGCSCRTLGFRKSHWIFGCRSLSLSCPLNNLRGLLQQ